jgi:hypothetical protein
MSQESKPSLNERDGGPGESHPCRFVPHAQTRPSDLAERSSRLFMKSWESERAVHENCNAITGRGNDVHSGDAFYHWGALLGVLSLLEKGL